MQSLLRSDPPHPPKTFIFITESSTWGDATNPDCIRMMWLQTQPSTWILGEFTNNSVHRTEIMNWRVNNLQVWLGYETTHSWHFNWNSVLNLLTCSAEQPLKVRLGHSVNSSMSGFNSLSTHGAAAAPCWPFLNVIRLQIYSSTWSESSHFRGQWRLTVQRSRGRILQRGRDRS